MRNNRNQTFYNVVNFYNFSVYNPCLNMVKETIAVPLTLVFTRLADLFRLSSILDRPLDALHLLGVH